MYVCLHSYPLSLPSFPLQELKSDPLLLDSFPVERLMRCMRRLVCDSDSSTRLGALRVLRYTICSNDSVRALIDLVRGLLIGRLYAIIKDPRSQS